MLGVVPAVLAAAGFAAFQTVNRRALATVDVYRGTATLLAVGAALLATVATAAGDAPLVARAPLGALAWCALAGFVHFFCGWTFLGLSQVRLGAARTGVILGALPLFGAAIAAAWLDEPVSASTAVGLVLVVLGVVAVVRRGGGATDAPSGQVAWGVVAGLAAALCWASSPVLIRRGLVGLPSPVAGAAFGMAASALVYGVAVLLVGRRAVRDALPGSAVRLLVAAGAAVSLSIWMQWTAFDLAPVALVLGLLQLTPVLVVGLAVTVGGDALGPQERRRVWTGAVLTLAGSSILVLAA